MTTPRTWNSPNSLPLHQKQRPARLCRSAESNSCQPPGAGGWTKEATSSPWKVIPHDTKVTNHSYSPINLLNDMKESKKDDPPPVSPPHVLWRSFRAKIQWYNCLPHTLVQLIRPWKLSYLPHLRGGFAIFGEKEVSWGGWEESGSIELPCGFHGSLGNATEYEANLTWNSTTYVIIKNDWSLKYQDDNMCRYYIS